MSSTKKRPVYVIDVHGSQVQKLVFLREDEFNVYARHDWQQGKGSAYPKLLAFFDEEAAYTAAAKRCESLATHHRWKAALAAKLVPPKS